MTFPTQNTKTMPTVALREMQDHAEAIKNYATLTKSTLAAGATAVQVILDFHGELNSRQNRMVRLSETEGIQEEAKQQFSDSAFDFDSEYAAMDTAIQDCLDWTRINLPMSSKSFIEAHKIGPDDAIVANTMTKGDTLELRNLIDALIATIG